MMLRLFGLLYVLLLVGFAIVLIVAFMRDYFRLAHDREDCPGIWRPLPMVERPWRLRCDRCGQWCFATRQLREQALEDLQMSQRMRALALEGAEMLRAERERAR